ncbi:S-adenosyl-L-methionine-dependent methyltransferase [Chaetomidium leptoderma]|uniref:S-adenosyl-L-methionine-dependent methyltransferase n=1 Tax=Chaetomidium leptoderma TaxID=669021 RepID=A0AAN6VLG3_9PEZI|nr:S-adenosyl-L-methionine-dependent methyltransferase [Chaetomidium leptoderma]
MPRLPPSLFWRARREISPMAAQLLPACRDLQSAANELRWIREHVQDTKSPIPAGLRVWQLVEKRGRGIPLQYVLGTQPFGDLEIKCRPGVLIPRPETEAYTLHLASLLSQDQPPPSSLSILDLCTGTGCIPLLLLQSLLASHPGTPISLHGIDISPHAINLARANHAHNISLHHLPPPSSSSPSTTRLTFSQLDIFSPSLIPHLLQSQPQIGELDLLVSNPPYISPTEFIHSTARAVRNHEPRLALVPPPSTGGGSQQQQQQGGITTEFHHPADIFYTRLLEIAATLKPKRVLMEVGGWEQAVRVIRLLEGSSSGVKGYGTVEIWRDEPAASFSSSLGTIKEEKVVVGGREVVVRGEGRGRAVYLSRV